jgi:hypothetical protein
MIPQFLLGKLIYLDPVVVREMFPIPKGRRIKAWEKPSHKETAGRWMSFQLEM